MASRKMPPKKGGDEAKPHPIIGRFGTSLKVGIVGLPNVGKSTFFNVLTKSQAAAENFPFCTIDPNESRVPVPDERFDFLCQYHKPPSKIPAFLNVVDIAGLVKGAHSGQGLGNAFLSHISACDGILHLTNLPWMRIWSKTLRLLLMYDIDMSMWYFEYCLRCSEESSNM
uniref:Obg like ATPase 1 n=1 Tax=Crocodylus porosus TaxID=8502 RepID=A0A7M4F7R5_CROPO